MCPCCSRSARKVHAGQLARRAHAGRLMRTARADPRVPRPCEPACVRRYYPGRMLRRCVPERSAVAICRLGAFLSVQPWQYIVLIHSRAFNHGSKLPWCIPEGATDGKNTSWWQHIAGMYSNTANFGKICVPCIQKALQNAVGEYTVRISCHQEALLLSETVKSCMACKSCHSLVISAFRRRGIFLGRQDAPPASAVRGWGIRKGDPCGSPFCWLGMSRSSWLDASWPSWLDVSRLALAGCETIGPDGTVGLPVGHRPASSDRVRQPGFLHKRRRRYQAGSSHSLRGRSFPRRGSSDPR